MPSRFLPRTHVTRMHVFRKASLKGNATPAAEHPFDAALWARLNLNSPTASARLYKDALALVNAREQALGASTDGVESLVKKLLQLDSHFFQVLDLAIERGEWPKDVREYHHRNKNVAVIPPLVTYDDAVEWAGYILAGETERQADEGGAFIPMGLPDTGKINTTLTALNAALGPHTTHKTALINAQQAVEVVLPGPTGMDKLILDLYNDVENHFRDLPDGARRDMCREWGLIYEGDAISGGDGGTGIDLPTAVQNLSIGTGPSTGAVTASWDLNPEAEAVTGYKIYRDGVLLATVTAPPAELSGFTTGEDVTLTISAINSAGEGPQSQPVTGTAG